MTQSIKNSRVVITGANRGIGLALCQQYNDIGHEVIGVCRTTSSELNALKIETILGIDVASPDSITHFAESISDRPVDILINNAGILRSQSFGNFNYEAILEQFAVNTLGPIRVVEALLSNLKEGSKIAMISSRMGSIEDNDSGGAYGYRMSKCALNAACKSLAIDLKLNGITVAILHPGWVETDMTNHNGQISADISAGRLLERIKELNIHNSGTFWHCNGEILPW